MTASWRTVLRTSEGLVLITGVGLSLATVATLTVGSLWFAAYTQLVAAVIATNLVFGRVTAISLGHAMGLGDLVVVMANMLIETVLVLLFYPLFVFSLGQLVEVQVLRPYLTTVRDAAERHQERIRRYGTIGLFLFVWSPFWMTGPIVGCAIGVLLGLSMRSTLAVVLAGTYVAILGWVLVMKELHEQAARISVLGPLVLFAVLAVLVVGGYLLRRRVPTRGRK